MFMLRVFYCFLIMLVSLSGFSQSYWAYVAGSIKQDEAMDICHDPGGNIITVGYFCGQTVFSYAANISEPLFQQALQRRHLLLSGGDYQHQRRTSATTGLYHPGQVNHTSR
jgi:hypothetical protein